MVVVIVIISVVTTVALLQYTSPKRQFSRQNVSRELKVALERARFDSVKRRADVQAGQARVVIAANSFTLGIDKDKNGTVESSENVVNSFPGQGIAISGNNFSVPLTVYFNQRGEVDARDASNNPLSIVPQVLICSGNCSTANSGNSDLLILTPTGTVNLLGGGSTVPTFAPPPVSTIGGTADVNPMVTVP
jgi:hypothetical protein